MKRFPATSVLVLSSVALFLVLGLTVTGGAQETPAASANDFYIYLPGVMKPPPRYALQFDGVDDFASIVDKGDFDFEQTLTVELWAKRLSAPTGEGFRVQGLVAGVLAEPPARWVGNTPWYMIQSLHSHGESAGWGMCVDTHPELCEGVFAERGLRTDHWEHLATTYNGSEMTLYLNGKLTDTLGEYGNVLDVSFVILGLVDHSFHGVIDEVRIWNVARTEAKIQADMNRSLRGDEPGLVGYWRLDEGTGQAILDSSSHGNDGRLGSTPGPDGEDPSWVLSDAPIQ